MKSLSRVEKAELTKVITDMYNPISFKITEKNDLYIMLVVEVDWGEDGIFEDVIKLTNTSYDSVKSWSATTTAEDELLWQKWLMAKGYHICYSLLEDNPYYTRKKRLY